MNSRVIGVMLIIGPILTMGTWLFYNVETSEMNVSETLNALLAEENKAQMGAMIRMFGLTSMFMGLYFLARSLKSDNSISNVCSEIGGLLLLYGIFKDWATRAGSILLAIIMLGAIFVVHIKDGWNANEWQLLILAVCILYAVKGNSINNSASE